jgi:hypothetical protein
MEEMRNVYKILVGKPEENSPLGECKRNWKDNIRMHLKGYRLRMCGLDSFGSGYDIAEGSCDHGNEPSGSIKGGNFLTSLATVSFSRRTVPSVDTYHVSRKVLNNILKPMFLKHESDVVCLQEHKMCCRISDSEVLWLRDLG